MARPLSYRHRIKVMEPVGVQDATTGEVVTYWQPLALTSEITLDAVPADVLTGPGREFREAGAVRSEVSLRVSFRWFDGLLPTHRIEWEGLGYDIFSIERDFTGRREYRVACRGEGYVLEAPPTPPTDAVYPLDDDGTVAASFGYGAAAATAPDYETVTYTYLAPATGNLAFAVPSDPWGVGAIEVTGIVVMELELVTVPAGDFGYVGLSAIASSGGAPDMSSFMNCAVRVLGGVAELVAEQGLTQAPAMPLTGFRIGVEFNGLNGKVTFRTTDGLVGTTAAAEFTPGERITFVINITDTNASTQGAQIVARLVPDAADMQLAYTAGAVDIAGNPAPN